MARRDLYRIDDVLKRAALVTGLLFLALLAGLALVDAAEATNHGAPVRLGRLYRNAPLLVLTALCPVGLLAGFVTLRRRERRIDAIWRLLERNAEIVVPDLLANSDFSAEELEHAVRHLNSRGLAHYVWDRQAGSIHDARLRSLQLLVDKCEVCSASISLQVPLMSREIPRCSYCGDPVAADVLEEKRREALAELRGEHREKTANEAWAAQLRAGTLCPNLLPFSMPVFVALLIVCWPAALVYAIYKSKQGS